MSTTPRFAVIGQPARHSLSPRLFGWLFEHLGFAGAYEAIEVAPEDLPHCIADLRRGAWRGLSVTAPHKIAVRTLIDAEDEAAARIGAVNTLFAQDGRVEGFNTDAAGCARAIARAQAIDGARVLILGAGGAARAAVFAAVAGGARSVGIANRSAERAAALASMDPRCTAIAAENLQPALDELDIVIQATSVGMGDRAASVLPPGIVLRPGLIVHDMVYRPLETALLRQARESGCRTVDGLWMLIYQALQQYEIWTGAAAPESAAAALHDHLSEEAT